MAKQLNVSIGFTTDTTQAKKQIEDLAKSLNKLSNMNTFDKGSHKVSEELFAGAKAAAELEVHLGKAFNTNTGKLDLVKFTDSIKQSGRTIEDFRDDLLKMGPEGRKTFLQLANAVGNAEIPMVRLSKTLQGVWTSLKNTARWQFSSTALHTFMGAIQGAYGYAQDLNKSLNSIRIVSGQSTEQMARFAEQANKASQALSTSTLAYTDASLIFYQQGKK